MAKFELSKDQKEILKGLKIKSVDEKGVRTSLLKILQDNGIDEMESEDTSTLIDMCESIVSVEDVEIEEKDEEADDEEADDEEADDEEVGDEEADDEEADDEEEVIKISNKKSVPNKVPKKKIEISEEELESLAEEVEEEEEEVKKSDKKVSEKKVEKKAPKSIVNFSGVRKLLPRDNEEDRKYFKFLEKYFPLKEYEFCYILGGVTIKFKGTNSLRGVISLDTCFISEKTSEIVKCGMYLSLYPNKKDEVEEILELDLDYSWNNLPCLKKANQSEIKSVIEDLKADMESIIKNIDKKLLINREKMETNLKKTTKKKK